MISAGEDSHGGAPDQTSGPQRSRDDRSGALHREDTVHGETGQIPRHPFARLVSTPKQGPRQCGQPGARMHRCRHDLHVLVRRTREETANILVDQLEPFLVDQIRLRDRDDHPLDAEEPDDRQVFARLGHHALVRGNHHEGHVHPRGTGDHGADESLVPGDIHDAERRTVLRSVAREAEFNGDAPPLLLVEPVRVDPGQGAHQRCLPVIDVAGRAEDQTGPRVRPGARVAALGSARDSRHGPSGAPVAAEAGGSRNRNDPSRRPPSM